MSVSLVTLNIEGNRHLDRFIPVLRELQPSVVCLQELYEVDCERIAHELGMTFVKYVPTVRVEKPSNYANMVPRGKWGIGLMTSLKVTNTETFTYGPFSDLKVFQEPNDPVPSLIVVELHDGEKTYTIATTHFTWSPGGQTTDRQLEDFERLKPILANYPELVLCGDFNAPRGREMFSLFETLFKDNVPKDVTTTIDNTLHYAGDKNLQLVVDSIFSTTGYQVSNVQVLSGVSDHMGIYASISQAT